MLAAVTQAARQPVSLSQEAHKNNLSIWTETLFALKAQPMFLSLMLRTGTSQVKILVWWKQRELRETFGLLVTWEWQQNTREKYVCVFCALKLSLCYSKQRKKFLGERNSNSRLKLTFRLGWFVTSAILFSKQGSQGELISFIRPATLCSALDNGTNVVPQAHLPPLPLTSF